MIHEKDLIDLGFTKPKDYIEGYWLETSVISIKKAWLQNELKLQLRYIDFFIEFWNYDCLFKIKCESLEKLKSILNLIEK